MSSSRRLELAVEELGAPSQLAQRDRGWRSRRCCRGGAAATPVSATRAATVCRANRARRSSGPVRIRALAWLMVWVRSERALRLATISARIASTAPSRPFGAPRARPDCAARAALTASSGSDLPCRRRSWRSDAVHLHDPDAGRGDVAGQAGAVAAGALDADQADGPEPAQPAQQAGIASRGDRELRDAEQPADGVQRGGDVHVGVGVHAAGDGACLYDGQCHLFSLVEGMARTRWPSDL